LQNYAFGVVAGAAYTMISRVTGSGLIGGAVASAGASSIIRGPAGEAISAMAGFAAGQTMQMGNLLGGFNLGGLTNGNGNGTPKPTDDDEI